MFTRIAAINARRAILATRATTEASGPTKKANLCLLQKRMMGGGGGYLQVSETHKNWGEFFGVVMWLWIFYRARKDLPVVMGFRHPWEHGDDHGGHHAEEHHHSKPDKHTIEEKWDKFSVKAMKLSEDDDDDEEEEDEEE